MDECLSRKTREFERKYLPLPIKKWSTELVSLYSTKRDLVRFTNSGKVTVLEYCFVVYSQNSSEMAIAFKSFYGDRYQSELEKFDSSNVYVLPFSHDGIHVMHPRLVEHL